MNDEALTIVSYYTLRRVVGLLGVVLPVVVAVWGWFLNGHQIESSISSYYALRTRDVFVGILFTLAWFLLTYHGNDWRDDTLGNIGCGFALGVALFPNNGTRLEQVLHYLSAVGLFTVFALFSLWLFRLSHVDKGVPIPMTRRKRMRNQVYLVCGCVIVAAMIAIGVYCAWLRQTGLEQLRPVFWLETVALWAFGFSWIVKGEAVLKDLQGEDEPALGARAG